MCLRRFGLAVLLVAMALSTGCCCHRHCGWRHWSPCCEPCCPTTCCHPGEPALAPPIGPPIAPYPHR